MTETKTPTIYDVKRDTEEDSPFFFDRKSMRFFGQTMKSFHVNKTINPRIFYIWARGRLAGFKADSTHITERYYVPGKVFGRGRLFMGYDEAETAARAE